MSQVTFIALLGVVQREEAKWAGQIKVNVIRELRVSSVIVGSKINKSAVKTEV